MIQQWVKDHNNKTIENIRLFREYIWGVRGPNDLILRDEYKPTYTVNNKLAKDLIKQRLYAVQDANFNVTSLVELPVDSATLQSADVVQRQIYDAYGRPIFLDADFKTQDPDTYDWDVLYGGYRYDQDTGLYHVGPRIYHPSLGRWLQRDPSGYADGPNLYQYGLSSPLTFYDPSGEFALITLFILAATIAPLIYFSSEIQGSADMMNRAMDTNDPELWEQAQSRYQYGFTGVSITLGFAAAPLLAPLGLIGGGAAFGSAMAGVDAYAMGGDFGQVAGQAAIGGVIGAGTGLVMGGVFRGIGFGLSRGYNRVFTPGGRLRTWWRDVAGEWRGWREGFADRGRYSWGAVRARFRRSGWAAPGETVHHRILAQGVHEEGLEG